MLTVNVNLKLPEEGPTLKRKNIYIYIYVFKDEDTAIGNIPRIYLFS